MSSVTEVHPQPYVVWFNRVAYEVRFKETKLVSKCHILKKYVVALCDCQAPTITEVAGAEWHSLDEGTGETRLC